MKLEDYKNFCKEVHALCVKEGEKVDATGEYTEKYELLDELDENAHAAIGHFVMGNTKYAEHLVENIKMRITHYKLDK